MRTAAGLLALPLLGSLALAAPPPQEIERREFQRRVAKKAVGKYLQRRQSGGSDSYAPQTVNCPDGKTDDWIRDATSVSPSERDYISSRLPSARSALQSYLSSANLTYTVSDLTDADGALPKVALAFSGGGYRAMLNGAGALAALDGRNDTNPASTKGLLQSSVYIAGLSGGSWLVGSVAAAGLESTWTLNSEVWNLQSGLIDPGMGLADDTEYYANMVSDVLEKRSAGYQTQITDLWGRALSYHLLDNSRYPDHGVSTTFSGAIKNTSAWENSEMPFPIVIALERELDQVIVGQNASIWEINPFEWGTFEPLGGFSEGGEYGAFVPIEYVGTPWINGSVAADSCVVGLENFGFTVGTSSTLFNQAYSRLSTSDSDSIITGILEDALQKLDDSNNDVALWRNPFYGWENDTNIIADLRNVQLVDGGEALENIPLWPLLKPQRDIDVILAFDASADTDTYWPNGTSLWATYNRSMTDFRDVPVPRMPNTHQMVTQGLNQRPVFFGCNASDVSNLDSAYVRNHTAPLIVYVPNYPYVYEGNQSTFKLQYDTDESNGVITNGAASASLNNLLGDAWHTCLACAIVKRSVERQGLPESPECTQCYDQWCWDGAEVDVPAGQSGAPYAPQVPSVPEWIQQNATNGGSPTYQPADSNEDDSAAAVNGVGAGSLAALLAAAGVAVTLL